MQNFVVLGLVPGTNFQITFLGSIILFISLIFLALFTFYIYHRVRKIISWIGIAWIIYSNQHLRRYRQTV